jgi:hypothetical protein
MRGQLQGGDFGEKNQRFLLTRLIAVKSNRRLGFQRPSPVIAGGE